ncbi:MULTISPECIES: transferrin-binding protein [unclassified Novosphingobium]|uniref:transferrin-binding protein n=1 Tax=unclassified Novosphingobium TaxID=2644732 RepID=UPI00146B3442|nr:MULTISPECIES: transferrin-binding protein [unclassified Novosphingobium]NMN06963.1 hypothetical protein [Novosphingobium sp. SG919]NMN89450.1 hypothetical protein [Novosphingobium sp. SG916]
MRGLKFAARASGLASALALAGCGGAGDGISSTPTPANASLDALKVPQSFTNDAATQTARFDLGTSNTVSGSSASAPLTITYNPSGGTYTITTAGRSQSFAKSDITSSGQGMAAFSKAANGGHDYLTLWAPSYGGNGPRYVGRAMWQHNAVSGNIQDTTLDMVTYGIPSPASAVPHTGTAVFDTDVFGITTKPGAQPRSFSGAGSLNVDFLTGGFTSVTPVSDTELVSGAGVSGGGIDVRLAGKLSASDGTFSGYAAYGGGNSGSQGKVTGRFYGPGAGELGAVFSTSGADGSSATGALLGTKAGDKEEYNIALSNFVVDQLFSTSNAWIELVNSGLNSSTSTGNGQLTRNVDGSFSFPGPSSAMAYGTIATSDQIAASAPNFTTYRKTLGPFDVTADFYTAGSTNTELALTYTSFAHFTERTGSFESYNLYSVYGIDTIPGIIAARTGTAHYAGVAYGTGIDAAANARYAITGTSSFDADFSAATLSGVLTLAGQSASGSQNYGALSFATSFAYGSPATAGLGKGGTDWGTISPRFYGPTGQEIGATFQFTVPAGQAGAGTSVAGAAVAKGG